MLGKLRVAARLLLLEAVLIFFLVAIGAVGLLGMSTTVQGMKEVYEVRTVPALQLATVQQMLAGIDGEMLRAFEHDPSSARNKLHGHVIGIHLDVVASHLAEMEVQWRAVRASLVSEEERELGAAFEQAFRDYVNVLNPMVEALRRESYAGPEFQPYLVQSLVARAVIDETLGKLEEIQTAGARNEYEAAIARHHWQTLVVLGGAGAAVVLGIALGWGVIRSITRPLRQAVRAAERIADGKLDGRVEAGGAHEFGELARALATMQDNLRDIVHGLHERAGELTGAARRLAATSEHVAGASADQSDTAASIAASVEELTVSVSVLSGNAAQAEKLAKESGDASIAGQEVIGGALAEMSRIARSVAEAAEHVSALAEHARSIHSIVGVVRAVADQTNMLALNAAIEAARAGEHGRGFAVVADEVRTLAVRVMQATDEIAVQVEQVDRGTQNALAGMQICVSLVQAGAQLGNQANQAVDTIRHSAEDVVRIVAQMNDALREQSTSANEIARQVERVARMAEDNSRVVADVSVSSAQMLEQSAKLEGTVKQFAL